MDLFPDFADLLAAFARHEVRYLIVGGYAVSLHARPRFTKDLDLWIGEAAPNRDRAAAALEEFGAPLAVVVALRTAAASDIVWFGAPPLRVDLLQRIPGVEFDVAWRRRQPFEVAGLVVHALSLEDLITAKRAAGRPKDRLDVEALVRVAHRQP